VIVAVPLVEQGTTAVPSLHAQVAVPRGIPIAAEEDERRAATVVPG
jgi:phosphoribosylcarboxyaminoimidazole (NCAIR) mutase